ncbi:MAG: hypothetical protein KatS3mg121_0735 [Gammaproteobacteria bacterium]|nr:MAG: hypothetical protein KatS3mg121_0735 [Gammaproteobacteria bacterium]
MPAAVVADVLPGDALDIVVDLQGGLLGKLQWRGWTVPLLSFEAVLSEGIPRYNAQTRSALLYSLSDDPTQPFIALTVQGEPKPLRVGPPQTCGRSTAGTATSCRAGC